MLSNNAFGLKALMAIFFAVLLPISSSASTGDEKSSSYSPATSNNGGMLPGCLTTGTTSAITLSTVPSRFIGVTPLSVFFDASGTVAKATKRPYHDLEYRWDFGDPAGSPVA